MGFSRQEYWSGLPFPSPGDLPDPGIEPRSPALEADTLTSEPPGNTYLPLGELKGPVSWLQICVALMFSVIYLGPISSPLTFLIVSAFLMQFPS